MVSRASAVNFRYPLDQVLTMYLLGDSGLIIHAAGVVRNGRPLVFAGVSGQGRAHSSDSPRPGAAPLALNDDRINPANTGQHGDGVRHSLAGRSRCGRRTSMPRPGALLFLEKGQGQPGASHLSSRDPRAVVAHGIAALVRPRTAGSRPACVRRDDRAAFLPLCSRSGRRRRPWTALDAFLAQPPDLSSA